MCVCTRTYTLIATVCSQDTIDACARKRKENDIRSYELQAKRNNTNEWMEDPRFVDYFEIFFSSPYNSQLIFQELFAINISIIIKLHALLIKSFIIFYSFLAKLYRVIFSRLK